MRAEQIVDVLKKGKLEATTKSIAQQEGRDSVWPVKDCQQIHYLQHHFNIEIGSDTAVFRTVTKTRYVIAIVIALRSHNRKPLNQSSSI